MGVSTRPSYKHRQPRITSCALAVSFFLGLANPAISATSTDTPDTEITDSIAQDTSHEVSISVVEPGEEVLSLAARLTTLSTHVARDVSWQIRNSAGEVVLDATANEVQSPLTPGEYVVEAQYGAVALRETLQIPEGNSVAVNFILNAGGLRVLPSLKGLSSGELVSKTMVYALLGPDKGKLIAHTNLPGDVLKLPAGLYRVESRLGEGNAAAVTDVRIRPGKMSAVEVAHVAGVARLNYVGAPNAAVKWDVRPIDGLKIASFDGLTHKLALKPGTYLAEAHVNGEILTAKFRIVAGEERDIMLGN